MILPATWTALEAALDEHKNVCEGWVPCEARAASEAPAGALEIRTDPITGRVTYTTAKLQFGAWQDKVLLAHRPAGTDTKQSVVARPVHAASTVWVRRA